MIFRIWQYAVSSPGMQFCPFSELNIFHPGYFPGCLEGIMQQVTQVVQFKFLSSSFLGIELTALAGR
jgi:hypothetical protein